MSARERSPWWMGPAALLGAVVLRLLGHSWRVRYLGAHERYAALARGEHCIYALWHAHLLAPTFVHRDQSVAALVSRSRDGELIARVIEALGYVSARGSSTRGGREGLMDLMRWAELGHSMAVTPDGPRGPAEVVKPGLVWLASRTGWPVVPVAIAADRAWRARSWDGFRVPLPFTRVLVGYGEPLRVPRELDEAAAEDWRARIEATLRGHAADVARQGGERP